MRRRFFLGAGPALALAQSSGRAADQKLALLGGEPVRRKAWPSWPQTVPQDETTWLEALRACKWWRKEGHFVRDFERAWAAKIGANHCIAMANGTSSLMASLHALDVGPKDEVIVSPYTFIATINSILAHYALPVFADSDPDAGLMDAGSIEARITPHTRCIMPVHLGGNVVDMDRVMDISRRRNIPVVEDACQAHLSEWRGRKVSTIGQLGCFSFQKFKNLPGGEAGAVITNDEALFRRAYGFHSHYRSPDEGPSDPKGGNGINLRLAEFQAAALLNGLTRLEEQAKRRDENAATLTALLREIPGVKPAKMYPGCTRNAYHLYMLRYDAKEFSELPRERFIRAVQAEGAPISAGYGRLNHEPFLLNTLNSRPFRAVYSQQEIDRWRERNQCPANDRLCGEGMWISQSALLAGKADMEDIAAAVRKVKASAAALLKA